MYILFFKRCSAGNKFCIKIISLVWHTASHREFYVFWVLTFIFLLPFFVIFLFVVPCCCNDYELSFVVWISSYAIWFCFLVFEVPSVLTFLGPVIEAEGAVKFLNLIFLKMQSASWLPVEQ